jgi:hypothetical protein
MWNFKKKIRYSSKVKLITKWIWKKETTSIDIKTTKTSWISLTIEKFYNKINKNQTSDIIRKFKVWKLIGD